MARSVSLPDNTRFIEVQFESIGKLGAHAADAARKSAKRIRYYEHIGLIDTASRSTDIQDVM